MKVLVKSALIFGVCVSLVLFVLFKYNFFVSEKETYSLKPFFEEKFEFVMDKNNVKKVTLQNGMTVLVFKNQDTPKVLVQIAYDIGSWVEDAGERGLAHLIEHMIFKGTKKMSESDIIAIARKYGATCNAFTSYDMTSYYFEANKNNWKPFIEILADCMQNSRFDAQHLASEFKAVIQELKMGRDQHWRLMFEKAFEHLFPANNSYHYRIIGYKEDLVNVQADNLKRFYEKYYSPERATLFIVGDVDIDDAVAFAKQNFDTITVGGNGTIDYDLLKKEKFADPFQGLIKHHTSMFEEVKKEKLGFYWLIPGLKEKNDVLLSVIEFILGGGEGSRLYRRLVEKEKVAVDISAMSEQLVEAGIFLIVVEPVEGKSDECQKLIKEEVDKIIADGVVDFELNKVLRSKRREFFQQFQSLGSFTYEWLSSYIATKDEFEIFNKVNRFSTIDSMSIQKFLAEYLDPFFMSRIEILPLPESKKALWLKAKEESEELDLQILQQHPRTVPLEDPKLAKVLPGPKVLEFSYPKPDVEFVLPNGLTVLLHKNGQWPILSMQCKFKESSYFAESKEGILLDFMMKNLMEGSGDFSKQDNVDFFETAGASYSFGSSGGGVSCLNDHYKMVFERFFKILLQPTFPKEALEKLRAIFIQGYERRKDSNTDVGIRLLKNVIYKNHPYEWTFDQAIEMIQNAQIDTLRALHREFVNPCNMIVTVAGNFDLADMKKNIETVFATWEEGECYKAEYPKVVFDENTKIDHFMLRDQVVLLFGKPSPLNIYDEDLVPVKLLNFIAFSSLGSRIYELREKTGLFYMAVGSLAAGATKEHGFDYMGSMLTIDKLDVAEKQLLNVVDELGKKGATGTELDCARQLYLKSLIDLTSSNESIAAMLSLLQSFELGFDYYDKVLKRVQTISLDELNAIAAKYFVSQGMARVRVGRVGKK